MGDNPPLQHVLESPNEHIDINRYGLHLDYGPLAESITRLTREYIVVHRREVLTGQYAEDAEKYLDYIIDHCDTRVNAIDGWDDEPPLVYRVESTSQFETGDGEIVRLPKAITVHQKFTFDDPLETTSDLYEFLDA